MVVESEASPSFREHPLSKSNIAGRDALCLHVMYQPVSNSVGESTFNIEEQCCRYFLTSPCVFYGLGNDMHGVCCVAVWPSTELRRGKHAVFFCKVGKVISDES